MGTLETFPSNNNRNTTPTSRQRNVETGWNADAAWPKSGASGFRSNCGSPFSLLYCYNHIWLCQLLILLITMRTSSQGEYCSQFQQEVVPCRIPGASLQYDQHGENGMCQPIWVPIVHSSYEGTAPLRCGRSLEQHSTWKGMCDPSKQLVSKLPRTRSSRIELACAPQQRPYWTMRHSQPIVLLRLSDVGHDWLPPSRLLL